MKVEDFQSTRKRRFRKMYDSVSTLSKANTRHRERFQSKREFMEQQREGRTREKRTRIVFVVLELVYSIAEPTDQGRERENFIRHRQMNVKRRKTPYKRRKLETKPKIPRILATSFSSRPTSLSPSRSAPPCFSHTSTSTALAGNRSRSRRWSRSN